MSKSVAEVWYGVAPCEGNVLRVREAHIDPYLSGDIWLVRGRDGDLIVDTGTGLVSPAPVVEAITGRPVLAIALCHFYDHAGGLHAFENRACHPLEAEAIANASDKIEVYVDADMMAALPRPGFAIGDYALTPTTPTRLLEDGAIIDLGDRAIEVLHLPGISPGAIGLWEAATGFLFASDTLFADPLRRDFALHDRALLVESLRRIRTLPVRCAFGGHYGRIEGVAARDLIDSEIARYAA
jgi:glyoxylase-like metal-dependent hydrolase (beta-lactamase superfamily II)